jgi:hypothetical protein
MADAARVGGLPAQYRVQLITFFYRAASAMGKASRSAVAQEMERGGGATAPSSAVTSPGFLVARLRGALSAILQIAAQWKALVY